jgi:hypothetical protein
MGLILHLDIGLLHGVPTATGSERLEKQARHSITFYRYFRMPLHPEREVVAVKSVRLNQPVWRASFYSQWRRKFGHALPVKRIHTHALLSREGGEPAAGAQVYVVLVPVAGG